MLISMIRALQPVTMKSAFKHALILVLISSSLQQKPEKVEAKPPGPQDDFPFYVSASVKSLHDGLYRNVIKAILESGLYFNGAEARAKPPFEFLNPEEVRKIVNFTLSDKRTEHDALLEIVKLVLKYSPHASHPYKVDRHGAGLDPYAVIGDWLGAAMSAPAASIALAPCYTLMEYEIHRMIRGLLYGRETGDGMVVPGAAAGNGFAIQLALQAKVPTLKHKGFIQSGSPDLVLFYSDHAFSSHEKFCIWEGIGSNACAQVRTDNNGRMDTFDLVSKIKKAQRSNQIPFLVIATAGTPVLGAIDPLSRIAEIAKKYKMWFHVDGQLAGVNIFSETQFSRLVGVEKSDSVLWSADRGLGAPFVTLVTRKEDVIKKAFSFEAAISLSPSPLTLNNNNSSAGNGNRPLHATTTRRSDILKLWFQWKAKGLERLAQHVDYNYDLTQQTVAEIKRRKGPFELLLSEFESPQVAFYYIPPALQKYSQNRSNLILHRLTEVAKVAERIKANLLQKGIMTISVNSIPRKEGSFFVMSLTNSAVTLTDVKYMLDQIDKEGRHVTIFEYITNEFVEGRSIKQPKDFLNFHDFLDVQAAVKKTRSMAPAGELAAVPDAANRHLHFTTSGLPIIPIPVPPAPKSFPDFVSAPIFEMHGKLMAEVLEKILNSTTYFENAWSNDTTLPQYLDTPEKLETLFNFSLVDSMGSGNMKDNEAELLTTLQGLIQYSQSGHLARFYNNLNLASSLDPYALMADFVTASLKSPMTTFEDNPMLTMMEDEVGKAVRRQVGYAHPDQGGTLILPGGSTANEIAVFLAYMNKRPITKQHGNAAARKSLVAYVSTGAHYAIRKGAYFKGIGVDHCVDIDVDERGKMSISKLQEAVEKTKSEGMEPFLVVATAGTPVLGSFDPIDEIADICHDNKMWLHVDGSYGGSVILSGNESRKAELFKGIARSDSFTFNLHKVFGSTRDSTCLVTKRVQILEKVSPTPDDQEFKNQVLYNGKKYDPGVRHMFTDRRGNVFKMWFLWKAKGLAGLGMHIDYGYTLTSQVYEEIRRRQASFELVGPHKIFGPEGLNVNFYYVPRRLREMDRTSEEFFAEIVPVQVKIVELVLLNKRLLISNEAVADIPASLGLSLYNSALKLDDVTYMLDLIEEYGNDL